MVVVVDKWGGGGLGNSCSSLILGDDNRGGEACDELNFDVEGWGNGRKRGPENWGGMPLKSNGPLEEIRGLFGHGFPVKGPEKACLLAFLASDADDVSSCGDECPDNEEMKGPRKDKFSDRLAFSYMFLSRGEECHKLSLLSRLVRLGCGGASTLDFNGN